MVDVKHMQHGNVVARATEAAISAVSKFSGRVLVSSLLIAGAVSAANCGDDRAPGIGSGKAKVVDAGHVASTPDSGARTSDGGSRTDGGVVADAGHADAGSVVTPTPDAGRVVSTPDAGSVITPTPDAGRVVSTPDAGSVVTPTPDAGHVVSTPDAGHVTPTADAGHVVSTPDAGHADAGVQAPDCRTDKMNTLAWLSLDGFVTTKQPEGSTFRLVDGSVDNTYTVMFGRAVTSPATRQYEIVEGNHVLLYAANGTVRLRNGTEVRGAVILDKTDGAVYFVKAGVTGAAANEILPVETVGGQRVSVEQVGVERTNYTTQSAVGATPTDVTGAREVLETVDEGESTTVNVQGPNGSTVAYTVSNLGREVSGKKTVLIVDGDGQTQLVKLGDGETFTMGNAAFRLVVSGETRNDDCAFQEATFVGNDGTMDREYVVSEGGNLTRPNGARVTVAKVVTTEDGSTAIARVRSSTRQGETVLEAGVGVLRTNVRGNVDELLFTQGSTSYVPGAVPTPTTDGGQ